MKKYAVISFSVAAIVVSVLLIILVPTLLQDIFTPESNFIRIATPQNSSRVSGIAMLDVSYPAAMPGITVNLVVDGRSIYSLTYGSDSQPGMNSSPAIVKIDWDTTEFPNGFHEFEVHLMGSDGDILAKDKKIFNVQNAEYRKQDFVYQYDNAINVSSLARAITDKAGLNLADPVEVGKIISNQDPCEQWSRVKIHFYTHDEVREASYYTKIASVLPLTAEQIQRLDNVATNFKNDSVVQDTAEIGSELCN